MKKIHFVSGVALSLFVTLHFINHLAALSSIQAHLELMQLFRKVYQSPLVEPFLLIAVLTQIISGIQLVRQRGWKQKGIYNKLHVYSGIYLGFFLLMHTSAILVGRFWLLVDTNFYYAAMVVNIRPLSFFYLPYYALGTTSFFVHIACIVRLKSIRSKGREKATFQANSIMLFGLLISALIIVGLTHNVVIPKEYLALVKQFMG